VLLVGVSAGGFGSIASASLAPAGLVAVVNFAGGRGSVSAGVVCKPDELVEAYGDFGKTVRFRRFGFTRRMIIFSVPTSRSACLRHSRIQVRPAN
jgi:hypothetical protein